jgi:hypothetical protein
LEVGTLDDPKVPTIYSLGFTERARRLQAGVKRTHRWLENLLGIQGKTYLAVFDEADWKASCIPPYGQAHTVWDGPRGFIVSSYDYHDAMIDAMLRVVAGAPPRLEREFRKLRGADEKNIMKFMDLVVTTHEVCHLFTDMRQIQVEPDWTTEMFAHYLTYAYFHATNPSDAKFWKLCEDIWASQSEVRYRKLEDYEMHHADMPLENYIWYQGKLNQRGVELYNRMGTRFAHKMVDEFALTEQEVYRRLNDISSDFLRWISGFG